MTETATGLSPDFLRTMRWSRREALRLAGGAGALAWGLRGGPVLAQTPSGDVRFYLAAGNDEEPAWQGLVDAFNATGSGVTASIEIVYAGWDEMYRKLRGYIAANDVPQIVRHESDSLIQWATSGELIDLQTYVERDGYDLDPFFPVAVEGVTLDGKLWGMPPGIYTVAWYYNKQQFAEAGLTAPTDWTKPWSFEDLKAAAAKLTSGEGPAKRYGFAATMHSSISLPFIWNNGGDFINDDRTACVINEPAAVEALQFQADLILKDQTSPGPADLSTIPAEQMFATNRVAIIEGGPWLIPTMEKSGIDWGVMPVAVGKGQPSTVIFIDFYALMAKAQNLDAAWEVLKFFVSPEGEQVLLENGIGGIPARKEVAEQNSDAIFKRDGAVWIQSLDVARNRNLIKSNNEAAAIYDEEFDLVKLGQKPVQEAADAVASRVTELIAKDNAG